MRNVPQCAKLRVNRGTCVLPKDKPSSYFEKHEEGLILHPLDDGSIKNGCSTNTEKKLKRGRQLLFSRASKKSRPAWENPAASQG